MLFQGIAAALLGADAADAAGGGSPESVLEELAAATDGAGAGKAGGGKSGDGAAGGGRCPADPQAAVGLVVAGIDRAVTALGIQAADCFGGATLLPPAASLPAGAVETLEEINSALRADYAMRRTLLLKVCGCTAPHTRARSGTQFLAACQAASALGAQPVAKGERCNENKGHASQTTEPPSHSATELRICCDAIGSR